mgnify:CR=1 FL=1
MDAASFPDWEQAWLRDWHRQDPVDEAERRRNEGVEAFQGNRNPYVDLPDLLDRITEFR